VPEAANPVAASVNQVNRSWTDTNGNFVPDCNLNNFAANGECGPLANQNFGGLSATTRYSEDVLIGGGREYNWDMSTEVQRQIGQSTSVSVGYYRNWFGNFRVTDNLAVTPADFTTYCVTGPKDSRLPGGGGTQVCGLADVSAAKFGQANNLIVKASDFGTQRRVNNFVNAGFTTRFRNGAQVGGGFDTGTTLNERCFVVDSPGELVNCKTTTPWSAQTQLKLHGSYPVPGGVVVSGVFQNMSGPEITASYSATTQEIQPSLGRPLSGGARTATVPLIVPGTMFEGRISRLDLRLNKRVSITQRMRVEGYLDIYNVMNSDDILQTTTAYGPRWLLPNQIVEGRLFQFGAQFNF
jgi:hypothetical protein